MAYEDNVLEEIERLQTKLSNTEPGSEEYDKLLKQADRIISWWHKEVELTDNAEQVKSKNETSIRELELEESKLKYQYADLDYRNRALDADIRDKKNTRIFKWVGLGVATATTVFTALFSAYRDDVGYIYDQSGNLRSKFSKDAQRKYDRLQEKSKDKLDRY